MSGANIIPFTTAVAWPAANRAIYHPMFFPMTGRISAIAIVCAVTGSGTFDLGIYDETCTNRLQSLGSTSLVAGINTWTLASPFLVPSGKQFYVAMSASTISATFLRQATVIVPLRAMGVAQQATAHPLPATATPAQVTSTYLPPFGLTFVT
jgi:hypothetical protein